MTEDLLMVAAITLAVVALDYRYSHKLSPEFFINHSLDRKTRIFFENHGKRLRFGGLALLWVGLLGIYFLRETAGSLQFIGACLLSFIGSCSYMFSDGWMLMMKKKKK